VLILVTIPIPEKIQSRNLVFPVFQIIGKKTKDNVEVFAEVFDFFLSLEHDATGIDPDFLPFKITGLGGGARGNVKL
jgi:hypothetical protein